MFSKFKEVVQHVIDEEHNLDLFALVCWTIWYGRNQIRLKHSVYPISQMLLQASQALQDFLHALPSPAQPSVTSPRVRWIPPLASALKINFDGALYKDINTAGLGVVFCDHRGLVLAENVSLAPSSDDVEAMAAAKAISFAFESGLSSIIGEGDSEFIIKALSSEDESFTTFGHLISTAKLSIGAFCSLFLILAIRQFYSS